MRLAPDPPDREAPSWENYAPKKPNTILGNLRNVLEGWSYKDDLNIARARFEADDAEWKRDQQTLAANRRAREEQAQSLEQYNGMRSGVEGELAAARAIYAEAKRSYEEAIRADLEPVEALRSAARQGKASAISEFAALTWSVTPLPKIFERQCEFFFDAEERILLATIRAPNFEHSILIDYLKSGASKAVSDRTRKRCQEFVLYALPLRLLHDLFSCPELAVVDLIGVNVEMTYTDKTDGHRKSGIVATIASRRASFEGLRVQEVDAKACFRKLNGLCVPSIETIVPVPPALRLNKNDRRIVASEPVLDGLSVHTNLAAMDWEQFEHLVRELFEKMFAARSPDAEVKVTRASRDWGVDAIVFDPDPIHGGKFVIQAKRYTNLVDVAAVRDLYGTVMNEGANRGYLVTTSGFGPEAREFAASKPLTLIDGSNLLSLFERFGYRFSIDLAAARALAAEANERSNKRARRT